MAETQKTAEQPKLGSSIVGTIALRDHSKATTLIIVPGHAIWTGRDPSEKDGDEYWFGGFKGEGPYYRQHAEAGIDETNRTLSSILVFSGGQTREKAGPRSEGASYWFLSDLALLWNNTENVKARAYPEELARDSEENTTHAVGRFVQITGRKPEKILVCGWGFKAARYEMHANALGLGKIFQYVNVNNPIGSADDPNSPLAKCIVGEKKAIEDFVKDPFGNKEGGVLQQKRDLRDWARMGAAAYNFYNLYELFPMLRVSK